MTHSARPTLAYILKGYPRISETFISNEILLLERLGFKMHLFPMRRPREYFCHDSVKQIQAAVDYLPTELLLDLPRLIAPNILCSVKNPGVYRSALKLACRRFQRTRKIATFKHLFQGGYLAEKHLTKNPAIIHLHGHFAHSPTSVTMFAAHLSGLPFSFTAHAKDIYTSNPDQLREKIAHAEFVATCTRYNKHYLETINDAGSTPIHCIYHGIDIALFNHTTAKKECKPPYQLLTVARMTEKKGLPTVYRALKILADRHIPFKHYLIGDGDDRDQILQQIRALDLEDHCSWLGTRTHAEVIDFFNRSDVFVLGCEVAKNGDRDGIPNVLVESLAMGVPAVSTNVSALPEILIEGKTGITVEPRDTHAFADAIVNLLTDNQLRKTVRQGGKELVQNYFNNKKLITSLAAIFSSRHPLLLADKEASI